MKEIILELDRSLGYRFKDLTLLRQALTHRSYFSELSPGETTDPPGDNERLEFLGDAVLGLAVSHLLMETFPEMPEGRLTKIRAHLVNKRSVSVVALELGLGEAAFLGRGEEKSGGRRKTNLLGDLYEAVLGAIYLDGGFAAALKAVRRHFGEMIGGLDPERFDRDYKTQVQELVQARFGAPPDYELAGARGPDHEKVFEVVLRIDGAEYGRGEGRSKKSAEQAAARAALARLRLEGKPG